MKPTPRIPTPISIRCLDPIIHSDTMPICPDPTCPCKKDRFIVAELGYHHAEYDQQLQSLRLSWPGDQTFLDEEACLRLLALLLDVFPDYRGQVS
jgi:hypothetical protein